MKYKCSHCSRVFERWAGRCIGCSYWNVLVMQREYDIPQALTDAAPARLVPITEAREDERFRVSTGNATFDRVLGGGLVLDGGVYFLAGGPGAGKSTLLNQMADHLASNEGFKVVYASGEETTGQVANNAKRIGAANSSNFLLTTEKSVQGLEEIIASEMPRVLIVDSVNTADDGGRPGNDRLKRVSERLTAVAKANKVSMFLIGHINKKGGMSGPKFLEHIVDCTLLLELQIGTQLRTMRADKNRFGSTTYVGTFRMTERGVEGVEQEGLQ